MHATTRRFKHWFLAFVFLLSAFLTGAVAVGAQGSAIPITIGDNKTGNISDPTVGIAYSLSVAAPQSAVIQVLAISSGFAPTFRVIDPGGIVILDAANPGTQTIAQGTPNLSSPGAYTIVVSSANGATGQYLISVQPGAPLAPPQALTPGQPFNGAVSPQTTRQAFSFSGLANDGLRLYVRGDNPDAGLIVALRDADTEETLALSSASIGDVNYRILRGARSYLLEVTHTGGSLPEPFTVCLATESRSATCPLDFAPVVVEPTAIPPVQTVEVAAPTLPPTSAVPPTFAPVVIDPNAACQVVSARG
ncbi:MAG: hypothetical protein IT319_21470, partial [Anaerolineae bacterium]|nr:hypothetical protein [Anaerolineae bacterium]